jgi:SAM-dependent methyltransferase
MARDPISLVSTPDVKEQTRSRIATGLDRAGLLMPAERLRAAWLVRRAHGGPETGPDGLPLPPPRLRLLVDGRSADADHFLAVGARSAQALAAAARDAGRPLEDMDAILDFGCGCGRVARHWASLEGTRVHGCDYNPDLVGWCRGNLGFMEAARNELEPPTSYADGSFDLVYALSVLSHLEEALQEAWVAEFRRLLRPGGLLVVSVLGDEIRWRLSEEEKRRFDAGRLVVQRPRMSGRNLCTAYHPRSYMDGHLLADFSEVRRFPLSSPEIVLMQDAYLARR